MKLTIKGYRNRAGTLDLPARLVLSGPNGSGKTNILDALQIALTGEAPARLGKSAARMIPYLDDAASTRLEGTNPFWHATTTFKKTEKSAKFAHATEGKPPALRPLFVDFGGFLDSPAERKRLLDGLIEIADQSIGQSARAGAQRGALRVLAPAAETLTPAALEQFRGEVFGDFCRVMLAPEKPALEAALEDLRARHAQAKAIVAAAVEQAAPTNTRDPLEIAAEIDPLRTQIAQFEAQDRDAQAVVARRNDLEARLGKLRAVDATHRVALEAQLQEALAVQLPPKASPRLALDLERLDRQIADLRAAFAAAAGGTCPTCGHSVRADIDKCRAINEQGQALKAQRAALEAAVAEAKAQEAREHQAWAEAQRVVRETQTQIAVCPQDPAGDIVRLAAELASLPTRFFSGDELAASRLRLRNLEQELEVARQARSAQALAVAASPKALELAGQATRAAIKGWEQGKAEAYAAVVGPIQDKMSAALGAPVTIDPANNWTITVRDRAAESWSGGQRLALWGAFVAALAKPGDVLLTEAAEADPAHLEQMLAPLRDCPAALAVVATHQPCSAPGWTVINPGEVLR